MPPLLSLASSDLLFIHGIKSLPGSGIIQDFGLSWPFMAFLIFVRGLLVAPSVPQNGTLRSLLHPFAALSAFVDVPSLVDGSRTRIRLRDFPTVGIFSRLGRKPGELSEMLGINL